MSNNQNTRSDLIGQRNIRIEKMKQIRELGIDPFPSESFRNTSNDEIIKNYTKFEGKEVIVAGRLMSLRKHGSLVFAHIQDPTERLQLYIKADSLQPTDVKTQTLGFEHLDMFDLGDIVEARGTVTKTDRGEISVQPLTLRMLTKAIRPLPDKWAGVKDEEMKFRQRYLDLIMDPAKKWRFEKASEILFAIRKYLNERGFLEIKTPILQPLYGGTNARPFATYMNALNTDFYMAVSHELYLKRLITAGFENVYNLVGYFRNEGIDRLHNPEFTMLETMTAYKNYEYNMELLEGLYKYVAKEVFDKGVFKMGEHEIDIAGKWERIMMIDAVKKHAGYDFDKVKTLEEAHKILDEIGYNEEKPKSIGESMVAVFEARVEEKLVQPTFVYGHPVEISPLAKRMPNDDRFVERFELFLGGHEQGDNWTELNDPLELFQRFKAQVDQKAEPHPMDIEFIECMEHGMPPTTGLGPGIERFTMLFTETAYIDDVIFFPIMRPAPVTKQQKEIYGADALKGNEKMLGEAKKQDRSKKMVTVLDEKLEGWQVTNAVGHLSAYLGNKIEESEFVSRQSFNTADGKSLPADSQYPMVTLVANQTQLSKLWETLEDSDFVYMVFTEEMIEFHDDDELAEALEGKNREDVKVLGIGIFGDKKELEELTGKYSLYK